MDVVECISPPMCGSHSWVIHTDSLVDIIHWRRTLCLWDPFSDMWQCLWHPEPFHAFRIHCFAKPLNRWLTLIDFAGWFCPTCVRGTWVTSWIYVILIWYNYIVICTLVTILNWWLSSKDTKPQGSIKEVLIVFHWLTFRITFIYISFIHIWNSGRSNTVSTDLFLSCKIYYISSLFKYINSYKYPY